MKEFWIIYKDILRMMILTSLFLLYVVGGYVFSVILGTSLGQYILSTNDETLLGILLSCIFVVFVESFAIAYVFTKMET